MIGLIRMARAALAVALPLAALGGCSSADEDLSPADEKLPVVFSAAAATGRAPVSNEGFTAEGSAFRVWGVFYDPTKAGVVQVFDGREVTRTGDAWTYDSEEYWMRGFTYDFCAVYPSQVAEKAEFTPADGANCTVTLADFTADGTDLMVASDRRMILSQDNSDAPAPVALKFRHILSRINFNGRTDDRYLGADGKPDDQARVLRILSFKVSGFSDKGSWNGEGFKADGSSLGEWTAAAGADAEYAAKIPEGGLELGNAPTPIFGDNDVILAIPQSVSDLVVDIEYEYTRGSLGVQHATAHLSGTWLPGKSYSYSFSINTHLFFDVPAVDDWLSAPINNGDFNIILP